MKRSRLAAALVGVMFSTTATESYGQGSLIFVNYSFGLNNYSAPVTIEGWMFGAPQVLGSDFAAQLLYSPFGTPGTFVFVPGAISQFYGTGLGDAANGGGYFGALGVTLPFYPNVVSGNAYFEVYVYNTVTVNGFGAGTLVGISNVAEVSALATASNLFPAADLFADNPNIITPLEPFSIVLIPEPSTIALGALGLVSLLTFRIRGSGPEEK